MNTLWTAQIKYAPPIKKYSQAGEEGYINFILDQIGHGDRFLVDIGASDGYSNSNTRYFLESLGYRGLLIDGDNKGNHNVFEEWITRDNVFEILQKYKCPREFTFLSLDLDGNDYDIINEILQYYKPRLVVCEINGTIPEGVAKKIKYNPNHTHRGDDYYGFSYSAAHILAKNNGYRVIFQNDALNVYMVREDLLPAEISPVTFRHSQYHPHNSHGQWEQL